LDERSNHFGEMLGALESKSLRTPVANGPNLELAHTSSVRDASKIGFNNPLCGSMPNQAGNIVDAKLLHHLLAMLLNGLDA